MVVSGSRDRTVRVWRLDDRETHRNPPLDALSAVHAVTAVGHRVVIAAHSDLFAIDLQVAPSPRGMS